MATPSKRFFELTDDMQVAGRWHLDDPTDGTGQELENPWQFNKGQPVTMEGRLKIAIDEAGKALDYTQTALSIPVVHVKVASIFMELASDEVQLLPVAIQGQPDAYSILVATKLIRCIDEAASRVRLWKPEDGQPTKIGQYASVRGMRIDKSKVVDARVFRPWGWNIALIVSEDIKAAMERSKATGMKFTEV